MKKRNKMDMWGSYLTPNRISFWRGGFSRDLLRRIEQTTGANPVNRQIGNIVTDLRNNREFDLINELESEIEEYNQEIDVFNRDVEFVNSLNAKLDKHRKHRLFIEAYEDVFQEGLIEAAEIWKHDVGGAFRAFEDRFRELKRYG